MIDYLLMSFFYNTTNFQINTRMKCQYGFFSEKFQIQVYFNKDIRKDQWKFQIFHPKFVDNTI